MVSWKTKARRADPTAGFFVDIHLADAFAADGFVLLCFAG
jgi:hypothetical protein